jgi:hypothetical protein
MNIKQDTLDAVIKKASSDFSLLLGAGASSACTLPNMRDFFKINYDIDPEMVSKGTKYNYLSKLDTEVKANPKALLLLLLSTLHRETTSGFDLETVFEFIHNHRLNSIDSIKTFESLFLLHYLCSSQVTGDIRTHLKSHHETAPNIQKWLSTLNDLILDLRQKMLDAYAINPHTQSHETILSKAAAYYSIIPKIGTRSSTKRFPTIFTTNYDTVFESLDQSARIRYQLNNGTHHVDRMNYFDFKHFLTKNKGLNELMLFKLHGSVTWQHDEQSDKIIESFPFSQNIKNIQAPNSCLLEPVLSKHGASSRHPFDSMYRIFEKVLDNNKICFAIGFSFRDDDIYRIVCNRLKHEQFRLVIVAPDDASNDRITALTTEFSNAHWIKGYFGEADIEMSILSSITDIDF